MNNISGYFMEPQNFSVNDGNGIRTIIFLAGCPLSCKWCANPESITNFNRDIYYNNLIHHYTIEEIIKIIEKQEIFYRFSDGGVTFSGGEPTLQLDILQGLVYRLYDKAIDLAIETSGYFNFIEVQDIFEKLNLIFIDIKHMDDNKHRFFTGVSNERILNNIKRLNELKVPLVVRIPVIVGVNEDVENIRKTARYVKDNLDVPKIELLPYHSFGDIKYEALGLEKPPRDFKTPSQEYIRKLEKIVQNEDVEVVSYK